MNRFAISFAGRHPFAGGVLVVGSAFLSTAIYFGLLAWAIVAGGGLGGPLALPGVVLMAAAFTVLSVLLLLLPSTVIAERLSASRSLRGRLCQIPLSSILLIALLGTGLAISSARLGWSTTGTVRAGFFLGGLELLLLGGYWWSLQIADIGIASLVAAWRRLRHPVVARGTVG